MACRYLANIYLAEITTSDRLSCRCVVAQRSKAQGICLQRVASRGRSKSNDAVLQLMQRRYCRSRANGTTSTSHTETLSKNIHVLNLKDSTIAQFLLFWTMKYLTAPLLFAIASLQAASAFSFPLNNAVASSSFVNSNTLNVPQHALLSSSKLRMAADDDRPITKPLLDKVRTPADLKGMSMRDLKQVRDSKLGSLQRFVSTPPRI